MTTFDELVAGLPSCSGPERFPLRDQANSLRYHLDGLPEFVPPHLSARSDVDTPATPSVLVISAAGAVGKSTLAREIARASQAPLWDLSESGPVGQHSLNGMIVSAFPMEAIGEVYGALSRGEFFFVIDALDEGKIKVRESAFEAFLGDIASLANSPGGVRFVLLGRTQIAETTWLHLAEAGVSTGLYVIEPFTIEQAKQYIEKRVASLGEASASRMREHAGPFAQARDSIFEHLRTAITGATAAGPGADPQEFIGYAPVLDAVSVLLAKESNYADLTNRLVEETEVMQGSTEHGRVALLRRIVERILSREHDDKLLHNLRPLLEPAANEHGWSQWDTLYTPDEQCTRLLGRLLDLSPKIGGPLPGDLRNRYEEQLESWLPDHPFLHDGRKPANVVFESYLFARALHDDLGGCRPRVEHHLTSRGYMPSRLLADFYLTFNEESGTQTVPPGHVGILYESLLSGETDAQKVRLSLEGTDPEDTEVGAAEETEGEFELCYVTDREERESVLGTRSFRTPMDASDEIRFVRTLRDATVVVPCTVSLGSGASEFDIGPSVQVRCRELRIEAETLVVEAVGRPSGEMDEVGSGVVLEATRYDGVASRRPIVRGELHVNWPGAEGYPWTEWHAPSDEGTLDAVALAESYRRFRRIVMTLRSHGKGSLARYKGKIEHQRVLQGALGERMLQRLRHDGLLRLEDSFYHWVPERASELVGVSWHDLRGGRVGAQLRTYLAGFIESNGDLFPE